MEKEAGPKENKRRGRDLTHGSIWRVLLVMAAPLVFGFALQTAFNLIDTFFIGLLGSEELAAISVTFPVVFIFIAVAAGLGVGATALVSQAIGGKKLLRASNIALHAIIGAIVVGAVIAVLGILFSPPLFEFMGVSGEILGMTIQYANLIFIGFIFLFIGFMSQGLIQADGDTLTPTRNLTISVLLNIILDPIFIFGFGPVPAMGLVGAGLATVLARSVGAFLNIFQILSGRTSICLSRECFRPDLSIFRKIVTTGLPASFSNSMNSIGMIILMSLVGGFGTAAIAAFGVGIRLESLAIMPVIGLSLVTVPIVGQNLGAGRIDRAKKVVSAASLAVIINMLFFSVVWFFVPEAVFSPFTSDLEIIGIGSGYFRVIAFGYLFLGLNILLASAFRGAGRTTVDLAVSGVRWAMVIVIAYSLVKGMGLQGIWIGFPVGNFLAFLLSFAILKSGFWLSKWKS
jgi:putative MATE family efflux protein